MNEARFIRLCVDHYDHVLGYALRRTAGSDDAADVVAEVFLVAWRRIGEVPAGDEARWWLYATARRVVANHHRGERRRRSLAIRLRHTIAELTADTTTETFEDYGQVAEAFSSLDADDRELLALVGWEGLERDAIAMVLGCSRATVRVRLHRARRRFAVALQQQGVDPKRWGGAGGTDQRRLSSRTSTEGTL